MILLFWRYFYRSDYRIILVEKLLPQPVWCSKYQVNTVEPPVSDHPKYKDWVVAYGSWSFTRIEPQGISSEKRSRHIYFMEDNLLHAMDMCNSVLSLKFFLYSYFKKGCQKKCTWQSRKVLWVVLSSLFFKEISKKGTRGRGHMFARAKGKQQKTFWQLQSQEQCIDHIPYYLSGLWRAHFCRQPFLK